MKQKWKNRSLPKGVYINHNGYVMVRKFYQGKTLPQKSFGPATPESIDRAILYVGTLKQSLKSGKTSIDEQKEIRWPFPFAWEQVRDFLPKSRHCYGAALKSFFSAYFFDELWFKIVEGYRPFRLEQKIKNTDRRVSDSTINLELGVLSSMYHTLARLKQLGKVPNVRLPAQSPTKGAKNRHVDEDHLRRKRIITGDEFKIIMEEASPRMRRKILAALNTGLRRKDIFALQKTAWAQYMNQLEGFAHKVGKSYKSPANKVIRNLFETATGDYVVDRTDHRGEFDDLRKVCREQHGMPDFIFKDFRRTAAWNVWAEKKDILLCQAFLNHKNIETTKRYLGITLEDLEQAGEILGNKFGYNSEIQTVTKTVTNGTFEKASNGSKKTDSEAKARVVELADTPS